MLYATVASFFLSSVHTAIGVLGSFFSRTGWRWNYGVSNRSLVIIISIKVLNTVQSLATFSHFLPSAAHARFRSQPRWPLPSFFTPTENEDSLRWLWAISIGLYQVHYSMKQIGPRFLRIISLLLNELVKPASFSTQLSLGPTAYSFLRTMARDFLGGPVVGNPPTNTGNIGLIPGPGTKIQHAAGQLSPCSPTTEVCMP